ADVYGLGAILYELLTGRPPFQSGSAVETLRRVLDDPPALPTTVNPRADRDLSAVALKCLEKDPERRYEAAASLAADLDRWTRGEPTRARPPGVVRALWLWLRANAVTTSIIVTFAILWGGAGTIAVIAEATSWGGAEGWQFLSTGLWHPLGWVRLAKS